MVKKVILEVYQTLFTISALIPLVGCQEQWRSRSFGRLVRWSDLPPYIYIVLGFGKWITCVKPRVLMP